MTIKEETQLVKAKTALLKQQEKNAKRKKILMKKTIKALPIHPSKFLLGNRMRIKLGGEKR